MPDKVYIWSNTSLYSEQVDSLIYSHKILYNVVLHNIHITSGTVLSAQLKLLVYIPMYFFENLEES